MTTKAKSSAIVIVVLLLLYITTIWIKNRNKAFTKQATKGAKSNYFPDNEKDINRHPSKIIYTKHAKCRMSCRHFTEKEVREILEKGKVNFNKSNDRPEDCPTYALEGETSDGQQSRMVFAFCNGGNQVKLITVIDLDTDWKCSCY
jgi:hypothetical protein